MRSSKSPARAAWGHVYRARDLEVGDLVALKILNRETALGDVRFEREASLLAELSDPAIVGYRDHGHTDECQGFLVMDWLDGDLLSERIAQDALSVDETIALGRRIAGALAVAHDHGIVHRDIKPSNIFLPGGVPGDAILIDFGVARHSGAAHRITATGTVVGTPDYMAPEQVRGEADLDGRADVFALGAVLFELLTGQPPFAGDGVMAVLVKILLADTPYVSDLRSGVPLQLDDLVGRVLSKVREDRPANGHAVAKILATLSGEQGAAPSPGARLQRASLTTREHRLLCMVMVHEPLAEVASGGTLDVGETDPVEERVRSAVDALGGRLELLADGSMVAAVIGRGTPTDHAAQAARCALAIRGILPEVPIALVAGRGELQGEIPVGEVVDRGIHVLRAARATHAWMVGAGIRVDELVAGPIDRRFEIKVDGAGRFLAGEQTQAGAPRLFRGKPTACVGRDRELGTLMGLYEECVDEPAATVALVTGAAGAGKSRVLHELLAQVAASDAPPRILHGRGEPQRDGSPFGLLAGLIRDHVGISDAAPDRAACGTILATMRTDLGVDSDPESGAAAQEHVMRTAEFLGQLCRVPFPSTGRETLKTARKDAVLMGDRMRTAWEDWLLGLTAKGPILLVIDDLQWGDLPSVNFIDAALRRLRDRPFMVLALARPDVDRRFSELWALRDVQRIALGPLRKKACEALAREVFGPDRVVEGLEGLIERSGGNPFYLEELLRAVA